MTAIHSPRRVLGDRDVNKFTITNQYKNESSTSLSLSKRAISLTDSPKKVTSLSPASPSKISLSQPKPSSTPAGSPMGNKRNASVLDDRACEKSPRKNIVGGDDHREVLGKKPERPDEKIINRDGDRTEDVEEAGQTPGSPSTSTSPPSLFDITELSQNTAFTESEHLPVIAPTLHTISQEVREACTILPSRLTKDLSIIANIRQNANALRLRLQVAMYKVRTNQTDIPLSRLQIRPNPAKRPRMNNKATTRTALPSSRPQQQRHPTNYPRASQHLNPLSIPGLPPSPSGPSASLPSPSKRNLTTPVSPRIREGEGPLRMRGINSPHGDRSRIQDLASSVIEGRAADGLLSLKEMR